MKRKRKAEKEGASEDTGVPDIDPEAYGYVLFLLSQTIYYICLTLVCCSLGDIT